MTANRIKKGKMIKCFTCENKIYRCQSRLKTQKRFYCNQICVNNSPYKKQVSSKWMKKLNKNHEIREKSKKNRAINIIKNNWRPWNYKLKGWTKATKAGFQKGHKCFKGCEKGQFKSTDEHKEKCRVRRIKQIEVCKNNGLPIMPNYGGCETEVLDKIEKIMNVKIERQYKVAGYFIDGYIPHLKLAFEIDELYHFNEKVMEKDIKRQKIIEKRLGCNFIRIKIGDDLYENK